MYMSLACQTLTNCHRNVYTKFQEQLTQDEEGWYETGRPGEEIIHCYRTTKREV